MASKQYERTIDGLIDACFDELQDLRDGLSTANDSIAFAKTAEVMLRGVEIDIKRKAMQQAHEQRMYLLANERLELTYAKRREETENGGAIEGPRTEGTAPESPLAETAHADAGGSGEQTGGSRASAAAPPASKRPFRWPWE
jgi:hypothetical protein